jgi:hypothetical protein
MSARETIIRALAEGVRVTVVGGDLKLTAAAKPSAGLIEAIKRDKSEIIALLACQPDPQVCDQCGSGPNTNPSTDAPTVKVTRGLLTIWLHPECQAYRERTLAEMRRTIRTNVIAFPGKR